MRRTVMGDGGDLRFQSFGQWVVLGPATGRGSKHFWICQCCCGTTAALHVSALLEGRARSCGCTRAASRFHDLTGQQFGAWLVLRACTPREQAHMAGRQKYFQALCRNCQRETMVRGDRLVRGWSRSCQLCVNRRVEVQRWYGDIFVLRAIRIEHCRSGSWTRYLCQCSCGLECQYTGTLLLQGIRGRLLRCPHQRAPRRFLQPYATELMVWHAQGVSVVEMARRCGVKVPSIYRYLAKHQELKALLQSFSAQEELVSHSSAGEV